jgi:glycosyltransferase involved in cell wall biosynthesis
MHQQGKPVIGWGLGAPIRSGPIPVFRRRLWKRYLDQFDAVIAYSQRGLTEYADIGYPKDRIYVAPNAVAPKPAHPLPVRPDELPRRPRILYIGRLQERKCIDNLFHACAAQEKPIDLVIVGDGPIRWRLESLANELDLSVEFTGYQTGDELRQHFITADLFVLPGTGGLAVQEAMAHGLPVIVAQGDGTQGDLVRTGNGWLIPNDDLKELSKTIAAALSDAKRLRRMGAESYRIVSEEINLERMVDVFLEVLREVTSGSRQRS